MIDELLQHLNIPAVYAQIHGSAMNVLAFSDALKQLRGLPKDASYDQLVHEFLEIQQDKAYLRIEMGMRRFLFVPCEIADVMAVYTASTRDELTQVANPRGLEIAYEQLRSAVSPEGCTVVLYLDANRFKVVNDTFGHLVGDRVLRAMCSRLRGLLKSRDIVARLGGDEFVAFVWLANEELKDQFLERRLPEIQQIVCQEPYAIRDGRKVLPTSFALGVHVHSGELPESYAVLLRQAEIGMYADKGVATRR